MDNLNPQGRPNENLADLPQPLPSKPSAPPPPPPEIVLRTMKSDLESMKEMGGAAIAPKPFTPPEFKKEYAAPTPPPPPPKIAPSEFGIPKKTEISPVEIGKTAASIIEEEAPKKGKLKIIIWGGILIIIIGLGLIGYFYAFPYFFPKKVSPPPPAITQPQTELPTVPTAEIPDQETSPLLPHQSLLKFPADALAQINLPNLDLPSLLSALLQESKNSLPAENLKEVQIGDINGQVLASSFLPLIIPEISSEAIEKLFENDFTAAFYYDENGVWPIYIFKLSLAANISEAQNSMKLLESSANLNNLFLGSPGKPNFTAFKNGKIGDINTNYLTFSKKGAALNIAWKDDNYIISASYNGLKKVLTSL